MSVVYIDQVTGTRSIVSVSWVGRRTPLHCTSNGKVLLAFSTEAERDRLLRSPLTALTPRTITDVRKLRAAARGDPRARLRADDGGARGGPERGRGAGPRADGELVAALSVSGPGVPHAAGGPAADGQAHRRGGARRSRAGSGYVERRGAAG